MGACWIAVVVCFCLLGAESPLVVKLSNHHEHFVAIARLPVGGRNPSRCESSPFAAVDCHCRRRHRGLIFSPLLPAVVAAVELDGRMFLKEVLGGACCRSEPLGKDFHGEVKVVPAGGSFFLQVKSFFDPLPSFLSPRRLVVVFPRGVATVTVTAASSHRCTIT